MKPHEDPNPSLEEISGYFPKLRPAQRLAASQHGIFSFDGNNKTTDEDLLRGMAAAADIACRASKRAQVAGLI